MRYDWNTMLPERAFQPTGKRMTLEGKGSSPPPPDYRPVAAASEASAQMGKDLGMAQLAESQRQYNLNAPVANQVVQAQLDTMRQTNAQGQDYYNYMQQMQRPVEGALTAQSMRPDTSAASLAERDQMYGAQADAARQGLYGAQGEAARQGLYGSQAEAARQGLYGAQGEAARQGLYGAEAAAERERLYGAQAEAARQGLYGAETAAERGLLTGGAAALQADPRYGQDIAYQAGQAGADQMSGYTRALNVAARQGMRYGFDPAKLAAQAASQAGGQSSAMASAMNQARSQATEQARGRVGLGRDLRMADMTAAEQMRQANVSGGRNLRMADMTAAEQMRLQYGMGSEQMRQANLTGSEQMRLQYGMGSEQMRQANVAGGRNLRLQDENLGWGRRMDVAGLYRGLPGASQGAYQTGISAGQAATGSQMAPGQAYMTGMGQGIGTQMQGQGQKLQGLSSVLGSQNQMYGSQMQANAAESAGMGQAVGTLGMAAMLMSDRRLKDNIELVSRESGFNIYEFNYKTDTTRRYRGVMADEVETVMPAAVVYGNDGFASVNYEMLGIKMAEV